MKVKRYEPVLADWGEADMEERKYGAFILHIDYEDLLEKYNKLKKELKKKQND